MGTINQTIGKAFKVKYLYALLFVIIQTITSLVLYLKSKDDCSKVAIIPNKFCYLGLDNFKQLQLIYPLGLDNSSANVSGHATDITAELNSQSGPSNTFNFKCTSTTTNGQVSDFNIIDVFPKIPQRLSAAFTLTDCPNHNLNSFNQPPQLKAGSYTLILKVLVMNQSEPAIIKYSLTIRDQDGLMEKFKKPHNGRQYRTIRIPLNHLEE